MEYQFFVRDIKLTFIRNMQDCFRAHPEMYGSELEDDEDDVEEELQEREHAAKSEQESPSPAPEIAATKSIPQHTNTDKKPNEEPQRTIISAVGDSKPQSSDEAAELVPKAAFDATSK
jgi:intermembrane space import and assembly protein 40